MLPIETKELELFRFFEMTPDLVCIAGKDGFLKQVNQAVTDTLGYTKEELYSYPIQHFIHPDDKEMTQRKRVNLFQGETLLDFENRYLTKEGATVWLHWTSVYVPYKQVVFAIAKDITSRKQKEEEIAQNFSMYKTLASHFKSKLEKDKRNLATELHEELAQLASVAKMDISWLNENKDANKEQAQKKFDHALEVLDVLINSIRKISYSISPTMLDDVGLNETLNWICEEFTIINGIPCVFESSFDDSILSHDIQLDLFRICQEALTNVMQHANAKNVKVHIQSIDEAVCLSVTDDGKGFNLDETRESPGLNNIRSRAASANGQLTLLSEPGKGTSIIVRIAQ